MNINDNRDKDFQKGLTWLGQEIHECFWLVGCLIFTGVQHLQSWENPVVSWSFNLSPECLRMIWLNLMNFTFLNRNWCQEMM